MKRTLVFATLVLSAIALLTSSCGTGDKIGSVSMTVVGNTSGTGVVNLAGMGSTLQLHVSANYTSGKIIDETNFAKFTITVQGQEQDGSAMPTPPNGISLNGTGLVTATTDANGFGVCTWTNLGSTSQPSWFYTGDYEITATYRGFTSAPVYIPVASGASSQGTGQCGPQ